MDFGGVRWGPSMTLQQSWPRCSTAAARAAAELLLSALDDPCSRASRSFAADSGRGSSNRVDEVVIFFRTVQTI